MEYDGLEEFESKVRNGEIHDFKPYFRNRTQNERRVLKQICIRYGAYQEAYGDWANDDPDIRDTWIQNMLAKHGYCQEQLLHAEDTYVRQSVLENNIRLALEPGVIDDNFGNLRTILMETSNPDKEVLERYLEAMEPYKEPYGIEALYLKQAAYKTSPTTIEATMTPYQLHAAGSPLWTLPYTGEQVALVLQAMTDPKDHIAPKYIFEGIDNGVTASSGLVSYVFGQ